MIGNLRGVRQNIQIKCVLSQHFFRLQIRDFPRQSCILYGLVMVIDQPYSPGKGSARCKYLLPAKSVRMNTGFQADKYRCVNLLHIVIYFVRSSVIIQEPRADHRAGVAPVIKIHRGDRIVLLLSQELNLFLYRFRLIVLCILNKLLDRIAQLHFAKLESIRVKQSPIFPGIPVRRPHLIFGYECFQGLHAGDGLGSKLHNIGRDIQVMYIHITVITAAQHDIHHAFPIISQMHPSHRID